MLLFYLPGLVLIGVLYVLYRTSAINVDLVFSDLAWYFEDGPLNGLVTYLGVILLVSSAAVCIFGYFVARNRNDAQSDARFLLFFGLFSAVLALDDLFMIHETAGELVTDFTPYSQDLGETMYFAIYVFIFVFFMYKYRKAIYRTEYFFVVVAVILFGLSILLDLLPFSFTDTVFFEGSEESLKFFAYITWFAYAIRTGYKFSIKSKSSA